MKTVQCILEWSATPYCSHRPSCRIARVCDCGVAGDGSLSCLESRVSSDVSPDEREYCGYCR